MTPKQTEIPLKQWVMEQSIRCGVKPGTIYDRLQDGKYGTVPIRRINQRVIFIEAAFRPPRLTIEALPGEKRLSQWVKQEEVPEQHWMYWLAKRFFYQDFGAYEKLGQPRSS